MHYIQIQGNHIYTFIKNVLNEGESEDKRETFLDTVSNGDILDLGHSLSDAELYRILYSWRARY